MRTEARREWHGDREPPPGAAVSRRFAAGLAALGTAVAAVVFLAVTLALKPAAPSPAPEGSPPSTTEPAKVTQVTEPVRHERRAYLAALRKINPLFVRGYGDEAVRRGVAVCRDIARGRSREVVYANTGKRFTTGAFVIGVEQIPLIVTAANKFICPRLSLR
ncbi:hypothetical protein GCM10022226_19800 [Sphaerisporangium flaviroseum]|uniref:DUF732 domain-containing protein n=1 Tax=Sphaerisporangium flaviroseum TaxID=509199 RepID=A0ABP7HNF9_9ACTN